MLAFVLLASSLPEPPAPTAPAPPSTVWVGKVGVPAGWTVPLRVEGDHITAHRGFGPDGPRLDLATGAPTPAAPTTAEPSEWTEPPLSPLPWAPGIRAHLASVDHPTIDAIISLPDGIVAAIDEDRPARGRWKVRGTLRIHDETRQLPPVGAHVVLQIGEQRVRTGADGTFEAELPAGIPARLALPDGPQSGMGCRLDRTVVYGDEQPLDLVWFCAAPC